MTGQGGVVTFSYAAWIAAYPEFAYVTPTQAQEYFNRATVSADNTPNGPVTDLFQRTILLNAATAHIAALFSAQNGQAPRGLVGRISNATQGSVSVQAVYTTPTSNIEAFWNQTEYGAFYWTSVQKYVCGFYVPPPRGINGNPGFGAFNFRR